MQHREFSAAHRENLFLALCAVEERTGGDWDQLFDLMRRGQQAAERAELSELAERFAAGRGVAVDELKRGGQFLDWELKFMQLGMATGNLSGIYRRMAQHYQLLRSLLREVRDHLWLPLALFLVAAWGLPAAAWAFGQLSLYAAVGNALVALIPLVLAAVLVPLLVMAVRADWLPRWRRGVAYRLPGLGTLLSRYQSFHFFSHLTMCLEAGLSLAQALEQSARCMPDTPVKPRYLEVARQVKQGERFSTALAQSGILRGVSVPSPVPGASPLQAQSQLTEAIHRDCLAQCRFWSRALPWLLLALLPLVLAVNLLSLSGAIAA